ncbi:cystathionine beta-lyase [Acinetobacter soli]|uniref:Cystathionine beta-lyase n=1 Tax=Acinetobacter soli TaxID=487316 RepID=A0A1P8EM36_9GAMM|nr:cystathionine beta-lyase [Acinetobacter soli]APV37269.1 cystathionine beta-lyase [Acinetobacter soli]
MNHVCTDVINLGRTPHRFDGLVNTPVYRGSTILVNSFEEWEQHKQNGGGYRHYGRYGAATTKSFESAINTLEGGAGCLVFPSGLSACTHTLTAFVQAGDHVLMADNVYGPTRSFADQILPRMGVEVEYFNPCDLAAFAQKLQTKTAVVYIESPGSMTFEVTDLAAISELSHKKNAKVLVDNSWATPLFFQPLQQGADVSIQSVTKYIGGHSDILMGTATANADSIEQLSRVVHGFGETTSPDDTYLASRGLRSLAVRLKQHNENGLAVAHYLSAHNSIGRVNYPALEHAAGHEIWRQSFKGATGLFSFYLKRSDPAYVARFFDALNFFHIGLSWGGFESLILPVGVAHRTQSSLQEGGYLVRLHVGLEHLDDLIADLEQALDFADAL